VIFQLALMILSMCHQFGGGWSGSVTRRFHTTPAPQEFEDAHLGRPIQQCEADGFVSRIVNSAG
jgi:hypothetical protein